jgi:hypothetical protein
MNIHLLFVWVKNSNYATYNAFLSLGLKCSPLLSSPLLRVKFEVLRGKSMKMAALWDAAPRRLVDND